MASAVFWISFFANQRGVEKEIRSHLLNQLISGCNNYVYLENAQYQEDLEAIYQSVMEYFRERMLTLAQQWQETEAGKALTERCKVLK